FEASNATGGTSTTGYASECYNDQPWVGVFASPPDGATQLAVAGGQNNVIDVSLATAGGVIGTVTAAGGGGPIADVRVDVFDKFGKQVAFDTTASDGTYLVDGLVPSSAGYTVCFDSTRVTAPSPATGYASECNT